MKTGRLFAARILPGSLMQMVSTVALKARLSYMPMQFESMESGAEDVLKRA